MSSGCHCGRLYDERMRMTRRGRFAWHSHRKRLPFWKLFMMCLFSVLFLALSNPPLPLTVPGE